MPYDTLDKNKELYNKINFLIFKYDISNQKVITF